MQEVYADGDWGRYHGSRCQKLADRLALMHGVAHALLCCSGTIAVELALRGLKIAAGDEVILAGYDFSGNFRSIEAVGARPVLVDIDPQTWSLDALQLEAALSEQTRAVIVSHLHGGLAPMSAITSLARRYSIAVVEDACQAPGAIVEGRPAGAWGDVGVMSFGGSKLLTAGRGGALLTQSDEISQRIKIFCERGNHAFPMSELQAAVLAPQLEKLEQQNSKRQESVNRLLAASSDLSMLRPVSNCLKESSAAYFKLAWLYPPELEVSGSRDRFIAAIKAEGVAIDAGFRGFVRRSNRRCRVVGSLPHSTASAAATLILHHPVLLEPPETIDRVAAAIRKTALALAAG